MSIDRNRQQILINLRKAIKRIGRPRSKKISLSKITPEQTERIKNRLWQIIELWYEIKNSGFFKTRPRSVLKINLNQKNSNLIDNGELLLTKNGVYWRGSHLSWDGKREIYLPIDKGDLALYFMSSQIEAEIILQKLNILLSWTSEKITDIINQQL